MSERTRVLRRFARRWLWWVSAVRKRECILASVGRPEGVKPCRRACRGGCF